MCLSQAASWSIGAMRNYLMCWGGNVMEENTAVSCFVKVYVQNVPQKPHVQGRHFWRMIEWFGCYAHQWISVLFKAVCAVRSSDQVKEGKLLKRWTERVYFCPWLLPFFFASWLPWCEQLSPARPSHCVISAFQHTNYGLNSLKLWTTVNLFPFKMKASSTVSYSQENWLIQASIRASIQKRNCPWSISLLFWNLIG